MSTNPPTNTPLLEAKGLTKIFPSTVALSNVNFTLYAGDVHAVVGENGAGKSTLIKLITGVYPKDGGTILLEGKEIDPRSPRHAQELGISTVYQEVNLIPTMSVAENIFPDRGRFTFAAGAFLVVLIVGIFLAHFTRFGRNVYALGGNTDAALLLGVPVGRTTIMVYALSSFLTTFAGIVLSLAKHSGDSTIAVGLELDVIAAVVIGGTLLTGGVGYVIGTFIAVMTLGTIQTYLTLDGSLTPWWIKIVIGVLLFAFVGLQKLLSSRQGVFGLRRQPAIAGS